MKEFLSRKGVKYVDRDVSVDREAAIEMVAKSGQRGVPVITFDDEVVVGFNRPRIEQILAARRFQSGGPPTLGISVADYKGQPAGALVGRVSRGSLGERLGLQSGDIIVKINDHDIRDANDVEAAVVGVRPGQRLSVAISRGGRILRTEAVA